MSDRRADLVLLGTGGLALAALTAFAPFAYQFPLRTPLNPVFAMATFVGELLWVAAMLAAFARDPTGPMWRLIGVGRIVAVVSVIWVVNTSLTWTVWQLSLGVGTVVFAHIVLAFPTGRLVTAFDRRLVAAAYVVLLTSRIGQAVVWDPRSADCFPRCQVNPFAIWPSDVLAWIFGHGVTLLLPVLAGGVAVGLWRRWRDSSPVVRRTIVPIAAVAPLELAIGAVRGLAALSDETWESVGVLLSTSPLAFLHVLIPAGFLGGLVAARMARAAVADLAVKLRRGVPLGRLQAALGDALRDPTVRLAFPGPDGGGLVDADGRPTTLPDPADASRRVVRIDHDSGLLAFLAYDAAIELEDPGRVDAVASVARMALENERLAAQVRAQLEEVRASRVRIVEAADAERRRIERDLHDGAQQRLVALAMRLDQARGRKGSTRQLIDATSEELMRAIGEVRDLARGVHPSILVERGLAAAIESLTERAPIPVRARVTEARLAREAEAAAYFLVAESVTNAVRHSGASQVTVEADVIGDALEISVSDDGRGGAEPAAGSGLQGLADRITAIGGALTIDSPLGSGTTLRASIPAVKP